MHVFDARKLRLRNGEAVRFNQNAEDHIERDRRKVVNATIKKNLWPNTIEIAIKLTTEAAKLSKPRKCLFRPRRTRFRRDAERHSVGR